MITLCVRCSGLCPNSAVQPPRTGQMNGRQLSRPPVDRLNVRNGGAKLSFKPLWYSTFDQNHRMQKHAKQEQFLTDPSSATATLTCLTKPHHAAGAATTLSFLALQASSRQACGQDRSSWPSAIDEPNSWAQPSDSHRAAPTWPDTPLA